MAFETVTCSRCGGSGQYSYCQQYGTTCFKCHGSGLAYTKRGQAAHDYYARLLSKPTTELRPGDKIKNDSIFGGHRWITVLEVYESTMEKGSRCIRDGVEVAYGWDVICDGGSYGGFAADHLWRVAHSAEQKAEKMAKAIAYQDTLTKAGTPRKVAA